MPEAQNIENTEIAIEKSNLYEFSRDLIIRSRKLVYQTANFTMVETYWRIGEKIVEEQGGEIYAKYGENLLKSVSERLTAEFGKGFTYVNLTNMRKFYMLFPNVYALRKHLTWTHYRSLIRVENPKAREIYMNEAADNQWSTRFLDQQVDKHSCERLISTHKEAVNELNNENKKQLMINPQDYLLRDPILLDFYNLQENPKYTESNIEQEKDKAEVKFSILNDNEQLFTSKYKLYIPTEEELIREITQVRYLMNGN